MTHDTVMPHQFEQLPRPFTHYPAVDGYTPMATSRRVVVALVDTGLMMAVQLVAFGLFTWGTTQDQPVFTVIGGLLLVVYLAVAMGILLFKSSRVAGLFLQARYVDVRTGRPNGNRAVLKFILQGLTAAVPVVPLIVMFATVDQPLGRNWFDRVTQLMLVDERTGRPIEAGADHREVVSPPVNFTSPDIQTTPINAASTTDMSLASAASAMVPEAARPEPPTFDEALTTVPNQWRSRPNNAATVPRYGTSGVVPAEAPHDDVGIITAVPGRSAPAPITTSLDEPDAATVPPVDRRTVPAPVSPRPSHVVPVVISAEIEDVAPTPPGTNPVAVLRGTQERWTLDPAVVIGRNPNPQDERARIHPIADPLLSKTHLMMGVKDGEAWVIDLHSTNGVMVVAQPGSSSMRIVPGQRVPLPVGAVVTCGGQSIEIVQ